MVLCLCFAEYYFGKRLIHLQNESNEMGVALITQNRKSEYYFYKKMNSMINV